MKVCTLGRLYERGQNEEDDDDADDDEDDDEEEIVVVENNNDNNNENEAVGNFVDLHSMINNDALITNNDENASQESVPEPMDESNDKSNKIYHRDDPCFIQLIIFFKNHQVQQYQYQLQTIKF